MTDQTQDVLTSGNQQEHAGSQSAIPQDLKNALDIAFQEQSTPQERADLQARLSGEPQDNTEQPLVTDPASGPAATPPAAAPTAAFDEAKYVKENFGFESVEEAKAFIQAQKAAPQQTVEPAFTNDKSKKIYEALRAGDIEPVYKYLEAQRLTANLESMTPEQQIKTHLKHQFPTLSQQMIDRQYNKMYAVKDEADYDDPLDFQIDKEMAQQKILNDAAAARNAFSEYASKVELPDIQPIQQTADADYEAWKASNAQATEQYNSVILPAINSIKEGDLASSFKIEDAQNQMNFEVAQTIDPSDLAAAKQYALNYGEYIQSRFYTPDGKLDGVKLMQSIIRDLHFDKYVQTTARQAVNAERKRLIAKETPSHILQRDNIVDASEKSDFQKQMDMAFSPGLMGMR